MARALVASRTLGPSRFSTQTQAQNWESRLDWVGFLIYVGHRVPT